MAWEKLAMRPGYLVLGALVAFLVHYFVRKAMVDRRIRQLGAVRAPRIAGNPFSALVWFIRAGRKQMSNDLLALFDSIYEDATPASPNCVEISVAPSMRFLMTREPAHVKAMLTGKFSDFGKGPKFHEVWSPFLGDSIFTTDGARWHDSRALIRPMFVRNRVRDLDIFDRWMNVLLGKLPEPGGTVDVMDLFYRMTLDVTTDFLLGHSVNSLDNPNNDFSRAFTDVQRVQMMLTVMAHSFVPTKKYYAGIKVIERFMMPFIEQALALPPSELEKLSSPDSNSNREVTFLHSIARYSRDPKVIRDQIMAVLLAGRDTTAATLSWCVYELSRSPATVARLRAEMASVTGGRRPTYEDLKAMTYLRHTLDETLRLYPAVPYNIRAAVEDTTLPAPAPAGGPGGQEIAVLKGDVVVYSALSMQRRADLYPPAGPGFPDPAVFCPDRWDRWTPRPWTYVPFNGGPRICVGQNFAMTEMAYCLVLLLQKYDRIEYRGDWHAQFYKAEIVGAPGQGVPVAFFEGEDGVAAA
ncbi:cytochrome P450 52A1 [Gaeumannomyces tritici R3-111a-1]|uniref:Cytochrome P450 52A1 n=1 Tax=Gaeumannomyces tritici (strain R3-111a-1) TaxID=644352 RepID=J3PB49_GAET3|nr:cytochrome P450 52A1 [Gaeumannomyces tritici R3-111a-1]EJT71465.1 cytochrome P450 52A1 [Gaeumannomyces tritici R3-111a-1]